MHSNQISTYSISFKPYSHWRDNVHVNTSSCYREYIYLFSPFLLLSLPPFSYQVNYSSIIQLFRPFAQKNSLTVWIIRNTSANSWHDHLRQCELAIRCKNCTEGWCLTSHSTHYMSFRGQLNQLRSGLNPTRTTPPCFNNTTLGNRLDAWHKVPHVTNPICWTCKNCSYKCAADCEHCVTQSSTEQFW